MLERVQVRSLAGPLKDIQRLVSKPLLRCLGCVLWVIVLLEGEPSPQSEVLSTPEQVFFKDRSVLAPLIFSFFRTSLPVPAAEKHSKQHYAATTTIHCRDGARFPPDVTLNLVFFQTGESCFSCFESPLGALWQSPSGLSCAFY
jgi:hypothetical protein